MKESTDSNKDKAAANESEHARMWDAAEESRTDKGLETLQRICREREAREQRQQP